MYNRVIMIGRIATDIDFKTTPTGATLSTFRIAVDRRFQNKGEEKKTDFFNIVAWRQQAEFVNRYFSKGKLILIEGELNARNYTDKNGNPGTWYEIVTDRVSFAPSEAKQQSGPYSESYGVPSPPEPPAAKQQNAGSAPAAPTGAASFAGGDDDYPF